MIKIFFQTRKELATLTRNLMDKKETRRFFFLAESLIQARRSRKGKKLL